jgi:predicted glutamine amidotransferase
MCRLLAFCAKTDSQIADFIGPEFAEFIELSKIHDDSWGLAMDKGSSKKLVKATEKAVASPEFSAAITNNSGRGALLHFRWASPGLPVTKENAHPFTHQGVSFIHNGALHPYDTLVKEIPAEFLSLRQGDTDSELFFLYLMAQINIHGFRSGVLNAITNIKNNYNYSSINSMIMNSEYLIVVSEHDPNNKPDWADEVYYELRYRLDEKGIAVASSGWDQTDWTLLKNHQILIVNRDSYDLELIDL